MSKDRKATQKKDEREERIDEAVSIIQGIEQLNGLTKKIKSKIYRILIWHITEYNGKYRLRYESIRSRSYHRYTKFNHEHVYTIKRVLIDIEMIVKTKRGLRKVEKSLKTLLKKKAIACLVTTAEHKKLNKAKGEGWSRYREAKINVIDNQTGKLKVRGNC